MSGDDVGYGKPPQSGRFKKGQSGNSKGRPRGRKNAPPYDAILGQMVTISEDGVERRVTAEQAFLLQLTKQGLKKGGTAARLAADAIDVVREKRSERDNSSLPNRIEIAFVAPGSVNSALQPLRMAKKLDRYRETARMALEPWIVEAALERLGKRRLSLDEQRTVLKATRTPKKVKWPDWWKVLPDAG